MIVIFRKVILIDLLHNTVPPEMIMLVARLLQATRDLAREEGGTGGLEANNTKRIVSICAS